MPLGRPECGSPNRHDLCAECPARLGVTSEAVVIGPHGDAGESVQGLNMHTVCMLPISIVREYAPFLDPLNIIHRVQLKVR